MVEQLEPRRALVLHSTSHLPRAWRERRGVALDWSWTFVLRPVRPDATRFHFRSRWSTAPWWFTLAGRLALVPADFVMSRDMLRGVKQRAELMPPAGCSIGHVAGTSHLPTVGPGSAPQPRAALARIESRPSSPACG